MSPNAGGSWVRAHPHCTTRACAMPFLASPLQLLPWSALLKCQQASNTAFVTSLQRKAGMHRRAAL